MLRELSLHNWKSFSSADLYIDPLTILIGANAGGKSNTLDALHFLQRAASGMEITQAIDGDANVQPIRGGLEWVCKKPSNRFSLSVVVGDDDSDNSYRYELAVRVSGTKAEIEAESLFLLRARPRSEPKSKTLFRSQAEAVSLAIPIHFLPEGKGRPNRIDLSRAQLVLVQAALMQQLPEEIQNGVKEVIGCLQQIFVFDPIPSHMRGYTALSEKLHSDGSNIAGVLAALEPARKAEVELSLTEHLRALPERELRKVWTETVGPFKRDAMLYCEEGWTGPESHLVDARGMSDGTLRYLAIVAAILTRPRGSLLVLEEVDNGLHPSRAQMLVKMLRELGESRGIDVLVTTHNPALLDAAGPSMVPFMVVAHRDDDGTSRLTLLEDLEQLPKLMAGGTLGLLSSEGTIERAVRSSS